MNIRHHCQSRVTLGRGSNVTGARAVTDSPASLLLLQANTSSTTLASDVAVSDRFASSFGLPHARLRPRSLSGRPTRVE